MVQTWVCSGPGTGWVSLRGPWGASWFPEALCPAHSRWMQREAGRPRPEPQRQTTPSTSYSSANVTEALKWGEGATLLVLNVADWICHILAKYKSLNAIHPPCINKKNTIELCSKACLNKWQNVSGVGSYKTKTNKLAAFLLFFLKMLTISL